MKNYILIFLNFSLFYSVSAEVQHPSLFLKKGELYSAEEFDNGPQPKSIELRSGSTGAVSQGIFTIINSNKFSKEETKSPARPVMHYHKIPAEFICHMRIKLDGESYDVKNPWLDIGGGHRNHFRFKENLTQFSSEDKALAKRKISGGRKGQLLPLNEWLHVTIEIQKGKLGLSINGKTEIYEGSNIETGERLKIAMKAIPDGKLHMDYIRIWEIN